MTTHRIQTVPQFVLRSHGKRRYQRDGMARVMLSARYLVELRKQTLPDRVGVCGGTEVGPPRPRRRLRVIGDREPLDITLAVDG